MKQSNREISISVFINGILWHETHSCRIVDGLTWSFFGGSTEGNHGIGDLLSLNHKWLAVNWDSKWLRDVRSTEITFFCLSWVDKPIDEGTENSKHFFRCLESCCNEFFSLKFVDFRGCSSDHAKLRDKVEVFLEFLFKNKEEWLLLKLDFKSISAEIVVVDRHVVIL